MALHANVGRWYARRSHHTPYRQLRVPVTHRATDGKPDYGLLILWRASFGVGLVVMGRFYVWIFWNSRYCPLRLTMRRTRLFMIALAATMGGYHDSASAIARSPVGGG